MKLSQLGEFGLIDKIRRATRRGRGVRLGIGDDAAWVDCPSASCLVTADLLLEGVHFNLKWTSLFDLGYKSLAVNLSDIAAMGGVPAYVIVSLGIPAHFRAEQIDEFYRGMNSLAGKCAVSLVGGDISVAGSLLVSVSVLGHAPHRPIPRHGAKIDDDIYVTGTLGDAALALKLLKRNSAALRHPAAAFLVKRHHQPIARSRVGLLLARRKLAAAMIDISDGLLQDLGHICNASGIGAVIWEENLPLSRSYHMLAGKEGSLLALCGGEDYELLFCARRPRRAAIQALARSAGVPITRIGACVTKREGITVLDPLGKKRSLPVWGHDHFGQRMPGD
ncbi:MAG TPA: thiamine-phosphate kinase [Candidatus Binatia bacterium]|jgi:thiamine-monophosphate kinase